MADHSSAVPPKPVSGHNRRMGHSLSVVYIVKNEELFLEASLRSVVGSGNEILVVDTGSSDRTRDIARSMGVRLLDFKWIDDFSAARNFAAAHASGDWLFFLDGDEIVSDDLWEPLQSYASNPQISALGIIQRNYSRESFASGWKSATLPESLQCQFPDLQASGYIDNLMYKLYRKGVGIEWRGRLHETIIPSCDELKLRYFETDLIVHHLGLLKPQAALEAKRDYYVHLARRKVEETPGHQNPWFEYGICLANLNRWDEAERALRKAVELRPDWHEAKLHLGRALLQIERMAEAESVFRDLLETTYHFEDVVAHLSTALVYQGKIPEALRLFEICESFPIEHPHFHINAATILFELKRWDKCRYHLEQARRLNPTDSFVDQALKRVELGS